VAPAVAHHLDLKPLGEGVDHRHTDAVQAARDGVGVAAELAPGVQLGHDHLERRPVLDRVLVDRDAAAVVDHPDPAVGGQGDVDPGAVAGQGLVDGVVDDLVDEVVQAPRPGRPDVHPGSLADGLQALQDGDRFGGVARDH
jgi:hypothetical protein